MNTNPRKENNVSWEFLEHSDFDQRQEQVLKDACQKLAFVPEKFLNASAWWGSKEIGAVHYSGQFQGNEAVLKIQGVNPATSEIYMIQSFEQFNQSKILRPPKLLASLPWNDHKKYEALILETIVGEKIINLPTTEEEVAHYFSLYNEYQKNCLNHPWLDLPQDSLSQKIKINFDKWRQISFKIYPVHPLRQNEDSNLIDKAVAAITKNYQSVSPRFQHGHLGDADLIRKDDQVVLLSNLYWSWKAPFYDAIFAYHWFIYHLVDIPKITPEIIEQQRDIWLEKIYSLVHNDIDLRLLKVALLERAAAGLNLDALSIDPNKPISGYLIENTRNQVKKFTQELA